MKDKNTSSAGSEPRNDSYTYQTDDGRGYTNPDGSHGFIYNPEGGAAGRKTRRYKRAVIGLSMVIVTLLIALCCLAGAILAARHWGGELPSGNETDTSNEQNTSGGLVIDDETSQEGTGPLLPGDNPGEQETTGKNPIPPDFALPMASIEKLPPKRQDANGDGYADIEIDENGQVVTSAGSANLTVATVVNKVAASVVEISTETMIQSNRPGQYIAAGAGSGVIISKEGFIVTNHHVIEGAGSITVRLNNGKEFAASVIGSDPQTDIAVLWIDTGGYPLTVATLGASFDLVVGEDILAIGNPMGALGGTVTEGMVSATARQITVSGNVMTLLQVSAPINPGNSGGGLFNMAGELVGIVNAKVADERIEGLGFAIPVDTAYEIILEIVEHGYVKGRPSLGFEVMDVTSYQSAIRYFNSFYLGVYVYDKDHDVVKYGDLILEVNGRKLSFATDLIELAESMSVGDTIELLVYREGAKQTVTITVAEQAPDAK
jgi:serine protease Do